MRYIYFLAFIVLFNSCIDNRYYDFSIDVPQPFTYRDSVAFSIQINDTSSLYNIYINTRHKAQYPYANMWIQLNTIGPDGVRLSKNLSLPFADSQGKWYGVAISNIVDEKTLIQAKAQMPRKGVYKFIIYQNSRDSSLLDILNMGLRLEQIEKK